MVKLRQNSNGKFVARKRLPDDVREEYGRLYGAHFEAKFTVPANFGAHVAKQKFREWDAEVTARIGAIRAVRNGEGMPLTRPQARALAGEWYVWFVARHPLRDLRTWEDLRDKVHQTLKVAMGDDEWERSNPDDLWHEDQDLRRQVRPVLADVGETAQFLAAKNLTLNHEAHARFIDWLYDDLAAALRLLIRREEGDYSADKYPNRFPMADLAADSGMTPTQLFNRWVEERKPAYPFEVALGPQSRNKLLSDVPREWPSVEPLNTPSEYTRIKKLPVHHGEDGLEKRDEGVKNIATAFS